ncbi:MAG: hypothetical protein ACREAN_09420 [Nitrosopumilaceae archaeon]
MKILHLPPFIGISIVTLGCFFLILTAIDFAQYEDHQKYLETVCNNPGTNCPLSDPLSLLPSGVPGLVLVLLGTYIISVKQVQKRK